MPHTQHSIWHHKPKQPNQQTQPSTQHSTKIDTSNTHTLYKHHPTHHAKSPNPQQCSQRTRKTHASGSCRSGARSSQSNQSGAPQGPCRELVTISKTTDALSQASRQVFRTCHLLVQKGKRRKNKGPLISRNEFKDATNHQKGNQAKAAAKKPAGAASKPSSASSKPKTPPNNQNEATHETKQHTSSKTFTVFRRNATGTPTEDKIEINKANSTEKLKESVDWLASRNVKAVAALKANRGSIEQNIGISNYDATGKFIAQLETLMAATNPNDLAAAYNHTMMFVEYAKFESIRYGRETTDLKMTEKWPNLRWTLMITRP